MKIYDFYDSEVLNFVNLRRNIASECRHKKKEQKLISKNFFCLKKIDDIFCTKIKKEAFIKRE